MPVDGCLNGLPLIADVTKTVLPTTIGDDQPCPGTSIDHFTCSVFDHVVGSAASGARPFIAGPRNPGHAGGDAAESDAATTRVRPSDWIDRKRILIGYLN